MSNSIFDLEQQLLSCWHVTDDIDLIYKLVGDDPEFAGLKAESEDHLMNLLLGLKSLYDLRFQTAWGTFESTCKQYHHYRKTAEGLDVDVFDKAEAQLNLTRIKDLEDCVATQEEEINELRDIVRDLTYENSALRVQKVALQERVRVAKNERESLDFDEDRIDIIGQNGNDGLHYK